MRFGVRLALLSGMAALCCFGAQRGSLAEIEAIADRETRSRRALAFASGQLDIVSRAYRDDNLAAGRQALENMGEAVDLAVSSLEATGKYARRHPRHFKHAEIQTRKLLVQLKQLQRKLYLGDQADLDGLIERIETANARLLRGLMGPRE
ncbi:MAG: hypothetical protein OXJ37_18880 [Bryobacterales bacterium]|nr:hypothetical protein [Bryobacterales bacterium]MDE0264476.1 hypothetical protein [Bryobacterales bacterium]